MGTVICIVGRPKTGKTVSACTFPKPILYLDFDRGFESVKNTKAPNGSLVVPDWEQITVIEFYKNQQTDITFASYASTGDKAKQISTPPEYAKDAINVVAKYNSLMQELHKKGTVTINGSEIGPFQSLVIDPLTAMFRLWREGILWMNKLGELRRGDYMTLEGILANMFIPNLKSLSDKVPFIVCLDHEDFDATDTGLVTAEFPVGPSKNMGKNLSEFFDNVWRMNLFGEKTYEWRTSKFGLFLGLGSRFDLPAIISPATYQELEKYLKKEVK